VGTFVTLVPTAKPDGSIFLSVSFDVTSAAPLVPFTVGAGGSGVTVQQKTIDGSGVIQEVPVRSGQTVVIGGIEQNIMQSTERRLGPNAPIILGGSDSNKITKSRMILLVTAVTEEGI
jgi:type II secretory pathway component HofQ